MSQSFAQGRHDGLKGLTPISTDPEYLEGHAAGKRRRSRNGKPQGHTVFQQSLAAKEAAELWGCKFYRRAARCPRCRTLNTKRTKAGLCLGCCMKQAKGIPA